MGLWHIVKWLPFLLASCVAAANFDACLIRAEEEWKYASDNRSIYFYHGSPWYRSQATDTTLPLALTLKGCEEFCGTDPHYYDIMDVFQILTTWVLPAIALMSQLPYESSPDKKRRNVEAFANWMGAPGAALTTTLWNINNNRICSSLSKKFTKSEETSNGITNAMYILSCINQHEYPRHEDKKFYQRRDTALARGVLYPYIKEEKITKTQRKILKHLNDHLAFQLRLQRRKGVYPIFISIGWFGLAFAFSIAIAFAEVGDNATAHSLALGLLLSWIPIMVFASVVDRNPTSARRCKVLIERWLFSIDKLFEIKEEAQAVESQAAGSQATEIQATESQAAGGQAAESQATEIQATESQAVVGQAVVGQAAESTALPYQLWARKSGLKPFSIGNFMGQGRTLRYCGIADTIRGMILNLEDAQNDLPQFFSDRQPSPGAPGLGVSDSNGSTTHLTAGASRGDEEQGSRSGSEYRSSREWFPWFPSKPAEKAQTTPSHDAFLKSLKHRPCEWYVVWVVSQLIVSVGSFMAFMVSFNTPTKGLGCRSMLYLTWWCATLPSWLLLGFKQEPPKGLRCIMVALNVLAIFLLFAIMLLQSIGGLNQCKCKVSTFGVNLPWGGYMDFENGEFYREHYPVRAYWGSGTGVGGAALVSGIYWLARQWQKSSSLWQVNEASEMDPGSELVSMDWVL